MRPVEPSLECGSRLQARLILAAVATLMLACIGVALTPDPNPPLIPPPGATNDLDLYRRVVERVKAGESYYPAAQHEMRTHGYPTRSIFNWRLPTYTFVLSRLPSPNWGRFLMCLVVVGTLAALIHELLGDLGMIPASIGGVFLVGSLAWCCGENTYLFTEVWGGVWLAFSLAAWRRGWVALAVASGTLALFVRELILPYVLIMFCTAVWERRRGEAIGWLVGLAAFGVLLLCHHAEIAARIDAVDQAMPQGWVRFGGLRFVMATSQANVFLMPLPLWVTGVYVALAVAGFWGWSGSFGRRVGFTAGAYLAAFCVVGAPFNFYWGFVDGPLLALGLAHAPGVLQRLLNQAFPREPVPSGRVPAFRSRFVGRLARERQAR